MKNKNTNVFSKIWHILFLAIIVQFAVVSAYGDNDSSETKLSINKSELNITLPINETNPNNNTNITTKINEREHLPINGTAINNSIIIHLKYNKGTPWDEDDDGIETTDGIIDFTVSDTEFNWNANHEKLCTRWQTYSIETDTATTVCYGSKQCCNFVNLASTRDNWSEEFYSNYGKYGATYNNTISTQVLYVDYNLSSEDIHAEVYYSDWAGFSARFYYPVKSILTKFVDFFTSASSIKRGETINVSAVLVDSSEKPIPFQIVSLYLNETLQDTKNSDILGFVEFNINSATVLPSSYILNISYPGQYTVNRQESIQYLPSSHSSIIEVNDSNPNISISDKIIGLVEISRPVKRIKTIKSSAILSDYEVTLENALNYSIFKNYNGRRVKINPKIQKAKTHGLSAMSLPQDASDKIISIEEKFTELEVEYNTPGPEAVEETTKNGKRITVSSDEHFSDILAYSNIPDVSVEKIRLAHDGQEVEFEAYDNNNNGLIDYIEWNIPHLSTEVYEIIYVTQASHLAYNREFVADIYEYVKAQDDNWTYAINTSDYVRITLKET